MNDAQNNSLTDEEIRSVLRRCIQATGRNSAPELSIECLLEEFPPRTEAVALPVLLEWQLGESYRKKQLPTIDEIAKANGRVKDHLIAIYDEMPAEYRLPRQLGHYTVERFIGDGGQARAVLATDESNQRFLLKYDWRNHSAHRLRDERDLLFRIAHPNVRKCYDLVTEGPIPFLVLEYVEGKNFAELIAERQVTYSRIAAWMRELSMAIDHIHRQGVTHHDIKPGNIMVDAQGTPKLIDFGMAVEEYMEGRRQPDVHRPGGTLGYMAPEQILGQSPLDGKACDIYSLGATLYHLLTRLPPQPMHEIDQMGEPSPDQLWTPSFLGLSTVPRRLASICLQAMEPAPENRFASAGEMAQALTSCLWWTKHRRQIGIAASLLAVALLAVSLISKNVTNAANVAVHDSSNQTSISSEPDTPPWYELLAAEEGFSLDSISADNFTLSIDREFGGTRGMNHGVDLYLECSEIPHKLIGHLQRRTKPNGKWAPVFMNVVDDEWYWSLPPEDQASQEPVELRLSLTDENSPKRILGPFFIEFDVKENISQYYERLDRRFDDLIATQWVVHRANGWRFSDAFKAKARDTLGIVAVGISKDDLEGHILHGGYIGAEEIIYFPRTLEETDIYVQLTCDNGRKSEVRHFPLPLETSSHNTSGGKEAYGVMLSSRCP